MTVRKRNQVVFADQKWICDVRRHVECSGGIDRGLISDRCQRRIFDVAPREPRTEDVFSSGGRHRIALGLGLHFLSDVGRDPDVCCRSQHRFCVRAAHGDRDTVINQIHGNARNK